MFLEPSQTLAEAGIPKGAVVADFGAGSGGYTIPAAKLLGNTGRVYAVDVQNGLLARIKNSAHQDHLSNVEVVWGDIEKMGGTKFADETVDMVIMANVLFQLPDKLTALKEAKRILKNGGRLLVIDWSSSFKNIGPRQQDVVEELTLRKMVEGLGFTLAHMVQAGSYHYGHVYKK